MLHLLFFWLPVDAQPLQNSTFVVSCQRILGRLVVRVLLQVFKVLLDYPPELVVLALLARWLLVLCLLVEFPDARSCRCRRILRHGCCRLRLLACGWFVVEVAFQHLCEILLITEYPIKLSEPAVLVVAVHEVRCHRNVNYPVQSFHVSLALTNPCLDHYLTVLSHERNRRHRTLRRTPWDRCGSPPAPRGCRPCRSGWREN